MYNSSILKNEKKMDIYIYTSYPLPFPIFDKVLNVGRYVYKSH